MNYHDKINKKDNIMFDSEDNDYGFFCELDQDIIYHCKSKTIYYKNLPAIKEEHTNESYRDDIIYKYNHNNMYFQNIKNAFIDNLNFKSIILYVVISFSSFYITSKYFNKNHI